MLPEVFDPAPIVAALLARQVSFVVIGGFAARLHGSPLLTQDIDVTPEMSAQNLERLSDALQDLGARVRHPDVSEGLPFAHDAMSLAGSVFWNLTTRHGDLDLSFSPAGTNGYPDMAQRAVTVVVSGVPIPVASLEDIVRSKDAANRDKDRRALPVLRELLAQQRAQRGAP